MTLDKFWSRVNKTETCWIWTGATTTDGYGNFGGETNGRRWAMYAHRFSYESSNGRIPKGLVIMHTCDQPSCVNPGHLVLGSQYDNMQDMVTKGRAVKPSLRKITREVAKDIRALRLKGKTNQEVADIIGTSAATVSRVVNNKTRLKED